MPPPTMRTSVLVLALTGRDSTSLARLAAGGRATMIAVGYEHDSASFAWEAPRFKNPSSYPGELTSADRGEMVAANENPEKNRRPRPVPGPAESEFCFGRP